jgi:rsbT antagonist protein RsbS
MQVPILKQGDVLIASFQSALTDTDLLLLQRNLVEQAGLLHARAVFIDVTVLDVIDSFACRTLRNTAQMLKLRGAETFIVGIQPEVAFSMVQLGVSLEGTITALDLDDGLEILKSLSDGKNRSG